MRLFMFNDFETIIKTMGDLPPVPMVAARVLQLIQNPTTSIKVLAGAISLDPGITGRVLKVANSVLYKQQQKVSTLERALVVLGETNLRKLIFETCLRSANSSFGPLQKQIWDDSIGCAIAARMISEATEAADSDEAFMAGLFRHIGKAVMANRHPEVYGRAVEFALRGKGHILDVERAFFAYSHEKVGAALLDHWHFPPLLVRATLHHHDLDLSPETDPESFQLAAILKLSGALCGHCGIGRPKIGGDFNMIDSEGARVLGLSRKEIDSLLTEFPGQFSRERNLLLAPE